MHAKTWDDLVGRVVLWETLQDLGAVDIQANLEKALKYYVFSEIIEKKEEKIWHRSKLNNLIDKPPWCILLFFYWKNK